MSFMSVSGVSPAKIVVKMLLSRGRMKQGNCKKEKEKERWWGRKTEHTPQGPRS